MSGLWQRRRKRVHLRRAISSLCKLDDHLLRDIGLNRLVLSYGFAASSQWSRIPSLSKWGCTAE
jgi:Domain of unknown function (DUF1127)